jgi:SAM-dependent methyltransferase
MRLNFPDRVLLEDTILPYIKQQADCRRGRFIGCDWYTRDYERLMRGREFWTIEIDPAKAKYGSSHHIADGLENLSRHFTEGYFDAIIHTGVFGWGVDSRADTEHTFEECRRCLRPGGLMVFGWDDVPRHRSFPVIQECAALRRFEPVVFPPLGAHQHLTADNELRHTFNFFRRPALWFAKLHLMLDGLLGESAVVPAAI